MSLFFTLAHATAAAAAPLAITGRQPGRPGAASQAGRPEIAANLALFRLAQSATAHNVRA